MGTPILGKSLKMVRFDVGASGSSQARSRNAGLKLELLWVWCPRRGNVIFERKD